jgi:hypothetical protein
MHGEIVAALLERIEREGVGHCAAPAGSRLTWTSVDGSVKYGHTGGSLIGSIVTPAGSMSVTPRRINRLLTILYRADHLAKNSPSEILAAIKADQPQRDSRVGRSVVRGDQP